MLQQEGKKHLKIINPHKMCWDIFVLGLLLKKYFLSNLSRTVFLSRLPHHANVSYGLYSSGQIYLCVTPTRLQIGLRRSVESHTACECTY
jgi:hypothetical protein